MRRWIWWIIVLCLLAGGTIVCAIRWKAWFSNPSEPQWVGDTIDYKFLTLADDSVLQSLCKDTLSFILLGDIHNSLSNNEIKQLYEQSEKIDFYAQLGDWMERPYLYYEQQVYQSLIATGFDSLPIVSIPGNHEYLKGVIKQLPTNWKNIFPNPLNGPARFLGSTYFVDFPHVRLIALDTDALHRLSDYTQLAFWLKKSLRDAGDKFTIVMMHHPVYSTAKGRQNPLIWLFFHAAMREADVVFSGHDHNYARKIEYYKARFWKKEEPTVFITTNASKKNYPINDNTKYECSFSGEPVYELIKITSNILCIRTYKVFSGELLDETKILRN